MSDLTDSPMLARYYCPTCQPEIDPSVEIVEVRWCGEHFQTPQGADDDAVVTAQAWISGSGEAGGDDNRRWCELFRKKTP